jgi:hypothetical protein
MFHSACTSSYNLQQCCDILKGKQGTKGITDVVYMVNKIRDDSRLNWGGKLADEMHSYINHYKQN